MMRKVVVFGLSITSSWGNGHATTYRGLLRELAARGHHVVFVERNVPWYANHRDLPKPPFCDLVLYDSLENLKESDVLRNADLVIVGSFVPDGVELGEWILGEAQCPVAFYDIDTPVTLAKMERQDFEYLTPKLIGRYSMYLSFTGGPTLQRIMSQYRSPRALPLYCSVDPDLYYPEERERLYDLGYMGTYSDDRQPPLERLMLEAARYWKTGRFVVVGPQYPSQIVWPPNVSRIDHLPPAEHREFYNSQRYTLNITRRDMVRAGWSPSVRLFEAAACGVPIISDNWQGLDDFFEIGWEILVSDSPEETLAYLRETPEWERQEIAERARRRVLGEHTAGHRAAQLESYMELALATRSITLM